MVVKHPKKKAILAVLIAVVLAGGLQVARVKQAAFVQLDEIKSLYRQRGDEFIALDRATPKMKDLLKVAQSNPLRTQSDLDSFDLIQETITHEIRPFAKSSVNRNNLQNIERKITLARASYHRFVTEKKNPLLPLPLFRAEQEYEKSLIIQK